jgi:thiol-disulfide isomerase/thioredoxin
MKNKDLKIMLITVAISLALSLMIGCSAESTSTAPSVSLPEPDSTGVDMAPQVGKLAPVFSFINADGKSISLSDMRGRTVMLNFWATWCTPCKVEMPLIEELSQENRPDLILLTINSGDSETDVKSFMKKQGYSFPVLLDVKGQLISAYQIRGIPTTFFIDKDGIIQNIKVGALSSDTELSHILEGIME